MTVPAFTIEFRASEHPNAPKLTVTGSSPSELQDRVDTALSNSLFALVGQAQEQLQASYTVGKMLDARPVDAPKATLADVPATPAASEALAARKAAAVEAPKEPAATPWGAATHEHKTEWPETPAAAAAPAPAATSGTSWPPKPAWGA